VDHGQLNFRGDEAVLSVFCQCECHFLNQEGAKIKDFSLRIPTIFPGLYHRPRTPQQSLQTPPCPGDGYPLSTPNSICSPDYKLLSTHLSISSFDEYRMVPSECQINRPVACYRLRNAIAIHDHLASKPIDVLQSHSG